MPPFTRTRRKERCDPHVNFGFSPGTPGGVIRYGRFAKERDPETVVAEVLVEAYRAASGMMKAAAAS